MSKDQSRSLPKTIAMATAPAARGAPGGVRLVKSGPINRQ